MPEEENRMTYTYGIIIDFLLYGQRLRYKNPTLKIGCEIICDICNNSEVRKILLNIYDNIYDKNGIKMENIKYVSLKDIINRRYDVQEYHILKKIIDSRLRDHIMFKERDIEIKLNTMDVSMPDSLSVDTDSMMKKLIGGLYKVEWDKINRKHIRYYHIDRNDQYIPINVYSMIDDIKEYEYVRMLRGLSEYHSYDSNNNYYYKLLNRNSRLLENVKRLDIAKKITRQDRESIILNYIKCRPTICIITVWGGTMHILEDYINVLDKYGNIYYVKKVNIDRKTLCNLSYWMLDNIAIDERSDSINKKMENMDTLDKKQIAFIVFDNVNEILPDNLEHELVKKIRDLSTDGEDECDVINVTKYFHQTIELAGLIFNKNSIDVLKKQDCNEISRRANNSEHVLSHLKFQTYRKIVYSGLSLLEMDKLLIIHNSDNKLDNSTIRYAYGEKSFNNITVLMIDTKDSTMDKMTNYINNMFSHKGSKIYFLNLKNNSRFSLDEYGVKNSNSKSYQDVILDPNNFFYFQGMKFISI